MNTENPDPEIEVVVTCPDRTLTIENYALDGLSVRAANCLSNAGIHNKEEALAALKAGTLHWRLNWRSGTPRNFGKKSYAEVCKWVGLPLPNTAKRPLAICPFCQARLT